MRALYLSVGLVLTTGAAHAGTLTFLSEISGIGVTSGVTLQSTAFTFTDAAFANAVANGTAIEPATQDIDGAIDPLSAMIGDDISPAVASASLPAGTIRSYTNSIDGEQGGGAAVGLIDIIFQNTGDTRITLSAGAISFLADGAFDHSLEEKAADDDGPMDGIAIEATASLSIFAGALGGSRISGEDNINSSAVGSASVQQDDDTAAAATNVSSGSGTMTSDLDGFVFSAVSDSFFVDPGEYLIISAAMATGTSSTLGSSAFADAASTGQLSFRFPTNAEILGGPPEFFPTPVPLPAGMPLVLTGVALLAGLRLRKRA